MNIEERTQLIEAARGDRPLDLVIRNVNLVNVFTCEIYPADIGIFGEHIAVVGAAGQYDLQAQREIDGSGKWATPGFVDTHVHIESTMVTPANYAAAVLPFGTTASVIDPHEIGNVLGMDGMRFMLEGSEGLPLRVYMSISSCVPAVPDKESAGADFGPAEVAEMLTWPRTIAIAEVMDYMGVVNGSPKMVGIIQAGVDAGATIQGHSPMLRGRDVNAYIAAGIQNDHELRRGDEGLEKLRLGLLPLLKVSSMGNHVPNILPELKKATFLDIALCTDDIEPADLLKNGHMDRVIREMIAHDIDPAVAIRWATYNGARHYGLRDQGAIAPGYLADVVLLSSLQEVRASEVFVGGVQVVDEGKLVVDIIAPPTTMKIENSVHLQPLSIEDFQIAAPVQAGDCPVNVITLELSRLTRLEQATVSMRDGLVDLSAMDAEERDDLCYLSVVPRHGQTHPPTMALLRGLGLRHGAMASSIAHDSHNIIVAGHNPADMLLAVQELQKSGGGLILTADGAVVDQVELPLAGLMSLKTVPDLAIDTERFTQSAVAMGITARTPALAISGLALTVIPQVRISDFGAILDVEMQEFLPLFV